MTIITYNTFLTLENKKVKVTLGINDMKKYNESEYLGDLIHNPVENFNERLIPYFLLAEEKMEDVKVAGVFLFISNGRIQQRYYNLKTKEVIN